MSNHAIFPIAIATLLLAAAGVGVGFFLLDERAVSVPASTFEQVGTSTVSIEAAGEPPPSPATLPPAPEKLAECFASSDLAFTDRCVHSTVSELLESMAPRALLAYTVATTSPSAIVDRCHAIGHIVGETLYANTKSLETALSSCSSSCRSSCLHGAIGAGVLDQAGTLYPGDIAHSDDERIREIGAPYCETNAPLCHGIGHLLFLANEQLSAALDSCAEIGRGYAREACYQGVFMERAGAEDALQPFAPRRPIAASSTEKVFPCRSVAERYRHACFQFLPVFEKATYPSLTTDALLSELSSSCASLPEKSRAFCFEGIAMQSREVFEMSIPEVRAYCDSLPTDADRESCTLGALGRFLFVSVRPVQFCQDIPTSEPGRRDLCYRAAFFWTERITSSTDIDVICRADESCRIEYEKYLAVKSTLPDYRLGIWGGR